jgi:two-component system nitrogen regulation response regulator NtrX
MADFVSCLLLKHYPWPGNIRELRNVVERLLLLADADVDADAVQLALPAASLHQKTIAGGHFSADDKGALAERVLSFERTEVLKELELHARNISQTAKALGLERSHLYKKCQQLGIDLKNLE